MQQTTHHTGRLGRAFCAFAIAAALLLALPAAAHAGRVFIDPGHGGKYPGAIYGGIREADVNLLIALELHDVLSKRGHSLGMSRNRDMTLGTRDIPTWSYRDGQYRYRKNGVVDLADDLQTRVDLANRWGADIFVSIHANASTNTSANGTETFRGNYSTTDRILSDRLASYIQQEVIKETGMNDRGVKIGALYVLHWSNMPAVLVEAGFLSNNSDRTKLADPGFRRKVAVGIARGIDRFFATNPFTPIYPRLHGADRYETASAIADAGWKTTGGTLILTSGTQWPDALTGTPLSRPMGAPILLTDRDSLPAATRKRIASQSPARIVVLGGPTAVSDEVVEAAVAETGREPSTVTVERLHGANRFETAAEIARRVRVPSDGRIFVTSGRNYADALSVAPHAGTGRVPILLVEPDGIPEATRLFIAENAASIKQFEVIGGSSAVSSAVVSELGKTGHVVRIAGEDSYATNLAVVRRFSSSGTINPLIATGTAFPDALCAGALGATARRPVILVHGSRHLPGVTREFLVNESWRTADPTIVGGSAALTHQMEWMIRKGFER